MVRRTNNRSPYTSTRNRRYFTEDYLSDLRDMINNDRKINEVFNELMETASTVRDIHITTPDFNLKQNIMGVLYNSGENNILFGFKSTINGQECICKVMVTGNGDWTISFDCQLYLSLDTHTIETLKRIESGVSFIKDQIEPYLR